MEQYGDSGLSGGMMAEVWIFPVFIFVCGIVFYSVCSWKIFIKAGEEGWKSIVPIYNLIIHLKIIKEPSWLIILILIPFFNIYAVVRIANSLSKAFGKDTGFTVGLIFLGFIFYPILAFGDAQYVYNQDKEMDF
jgi:hypothetical protein